MNNVGFVGLGLIGGSLAKAAALTAGSVYTLYAMDANESVIDKSISAGIIKKRLTKENAKELDFLIVTLFPADAVEVIKEYEPYLRRGCIVVDSTGVKEVVCEKLSLYLNEKGIYFIGGHPMAGKEVSGYDNSDAALFKGASMIMCKDEYTDEEALNAACDFYRELGFLKVVVTTPKEHDEVIAYTSQMAHVVSSAYVKSETLSKRQGFSAGSYKDMTRVAKLNENVWADLFLANDRALLSEIDSFIGHMKEYRDALAGGDRDALVSLLKRGRELKEADTRAEL